MALKVIAGVMLVEITMKVISVVLVIGVWVWVMWELLRERPS